MGIIQDRKEVKENRKRNKWAAQGPMCREEPNEDASFLSKETHSVFLCSFRM
jgi:hypothetical protein